MKATHKTLILFLLFCHTTVLFSQADSTKYGVVIPKGFTSQIDVVYKEIADWQGKMDIYLPPKTHKPTAIVINIHGGGWNHGSKEQQTGFNSFFKENIAVANIAYRLVQKAPAPAAVEDVRCALIYLVNHAKELNIDPSRIIIMGGSAGGHLALMGGYLQNNSLFDTSCSKKTEIKVAAVINKYGIGNMVIFSTGDKAYKSAVNWLGINVKSVPFMQSVSPITYINAQTPPTFIVHGDADPIVPYQQSVDLYKKLLDNNVKTEFVTVAGGGHGKFEKDKNSEVNKAIITFLEGLGLTN